MKKLNRFSRSWAEVCLMCTCAWEELHGGLVPHGVYDSLAPEPQHPGLEVFLGQEGGQTEGGAGQAVCNYPSENRSVPSVLLTSANAPVLHSVRPVVHLVVDEVPQLGLRPARRGGAVDLQEVTRHEPLALHRPRVELRS